MTETQAIYLEQLPPTLLRFLAFTKSHDLDKAIQTYQNRYGQPPANIIRHKGNLYLGPVPQVEREMR